MTQEFESGRRTLCDKNKVVLNGNRLQSPKTGSNRIILKRKKKTGIHFELFS